MRSRIRSFLAVYLTVLTGAILCISPPLKASSPDWIWAKAIRLTEADGINSEYPEIAAHPDSGKLHVVWRDERYRADHTPCMYYKNSTKRSMKWSEDVRISSQRARNIAFAIDYGGNLHVMWDLVTNLDELRIWYSRSEDGGLIWVGGDKFLDGKAPHLATDADGIHLLYQTGNYGAQIRSSYDHGNNWTTYHNVCSTDWTRGWYAIASKLISDSHGLHALYYWDHSSYGRNLTYRGSSDGGATWGEETIVRRKDTGEEIDFGCDMCSDGQDILHAAWAEKDDGGKLTIRYTKSLDAGQNWLAPQVLDNGSADSKLPRIASYGDNIYVVWSDSRDGNGEIYYKTSSDNGANWSEDKRLTNAPGVSEYPSIAVDEEGVYIVWHDNRDGSSEIYYKYLGSNLIPVVQIYAPVGGEAWKETQEIKWYAEEFNEGQIMQNLGIQYSADGNTWTDIMFDGVNDGSLMWDTRTVPDNSYMIRITADDGIGQGLDSSELIIIDNTPPTKVSDLVSISHTVMQWSANGQIAVRWTAATDTGTGVDGYSIVWDESPDTIPDVEKDIEELTTGASSPDLGNGDKHYFHIRAVDNIGNWGESEHSGPFYIDVTPPNTEIELFGDIGLNEWYISDVKVTLPATDNASGVKQTEYRINNGAWQIYSADFAITGSTVSYRSEDNAGNMEPEGLREIKIDKTQPEPPIVKDDGDITRSTDQLHATWSCFDNESGIAEYQYSIFYEVEDIEIIIVPWTSVGEDTEVTATGLELIHGNTYFFDVKARDHAGNWSSVGYSNGITVDTNIYVALSGDDVTGTGSQRKPYRTIQKGIDKANDGDTVMVANGIYTGEDNVNLDFKGKGITVRSENGAANCIIDCENLDSIRGFYIHSKEGADSVVDGFTIRNGNASGGGGIFCMDSSPRIINNIITANSASSSGGGIYCVGFSSPIIGNNIITGNSAVHGGGGGIYCNQSSATITNNLITGNSSSQVCGGIWCNSSSMEIVNNTIAGNSPGAIACSSGSSLTITNTILWDNDEVYGIYFFDSGDPNTASISHSDIQDGLSGIVTNDNGIINWLDGNIDSGPLFVDAVNGDYHLSDDSPCIDAGIMTPDVPDTDIEGNPRPYPPGSNPNIGAYEAGADIPPPPDISSKTHDEDVCSDNNDPSFTWTEPIDTSGISGYSYVLDHSPDTIPDTTPEGTSKSVDYTDVDDGVWYFHVRAVNGTGAWGKTDHYGPILLPKESILNLRAEPSNIEFGEAVSLSGQLDAPELTDLEGQKIHFQTVRLSEESWEHILLFDTDPGFQNDLDNGIISEGLIQGFTDNRTVLSPNADVSIEENGSKWLITDTDNKATYFAEKDEDRLFIYLGGLTDSSGRFETNLSLDKVGTWRFRAVWDGIKDANDCYLYASAVSKDAEVVVKSPLGKAVIAVGGDPSDDTWERFFKLGKRAYDVFSKCGFLDENIRFLCPDPTRSPIKDQQLYITKQTLEDSILTWGVAGLDSSQILYIYMVSDNIKEHGFILSRGLYGAERLYKDEVHQWLEQLTSEGLNVVFIMDSCYSGEYIQETEQSLNPPLRIVITSTDAENAATVTPDESFSKLFFDQLNAGSDLKNAYLGAVNSMATVDYPNKPQIDTNGNTISLEQGELDPLEGLYLGRCIGDNTGGDKPNIAIWTKAQILARGVNEATIEASIRGGGVTAYAVIFSPGQLDIDTVESWESFEGYSIPLTGDENTGYSGTYDGFTAPGTYTIRVYAENIDGVAVPVTTTVTVPVPEDLNLDGVVDILDVVTVASRIGTNDPDGDVNNDGKVDKEDLELVIQNCVANRE